MDGAASSDHCYSNLCKVNLLRFTLCSLIVSCDWSTSHLPSKVAPSGTQCRGIFWLSLLTLGIQASGISIPLYYRRCCGLRIGRQCLISALFRTFTAELWPSLCHATLRLAIRQEDILQAPCHAKSILSKDLPIHTI